LAGSGGAIGLSVADEVHDRSNDQGDERGQDAGGEASGYGTADKGTDDAAGQVPDELAEGSVEPSYVLSKFGP